ncbi:MAG: hypothetical protein WKG07_33145 [Hymenobacter sp.]
MATKAKITKKYFIGRFTRGRGGWLVRLVSGLANASNMAARPLYLATVLPSVVLYPVLLAILPLSEL